MQFDRFKKLVGDNIFNNIQNKTVLIVGIGGVGGYALEAIVRSGINNIIIVDKDIIDITNLNRQIITTINNIGRLKVTIAKERALSINPNLNIITHNIFLTQENIDEIITENIDYVIDACDTIDTKKAIITKCLKNNIKFISCMGSANKFRPELLEITTLNKTSYDKLAKKLRKWAKDNNIKDNIPVVTSKEEVKSSAFLGSTSFVPATAGLLCASYIINDIIKKGN